MARNTFVTPEPVVLEGYQAVMQPSKFGYSLKAVVDQDMIDKLEDDRTDTLKWAESKLKNPKRSSLKPEPWEEVADGKYTIKFSWNEDSKPPIVDTEGTAITDTRTPIYSGSQVKLAFFQKPYILIKMVSPMARLLSWLVSKLFLATAKLVLMQVTWHQKMSRNCSVKHKASKPTIRT
jgi:hypothetical protein